LTELEEKSFRLILKYRQVLEENFNWLLFTPLVAFSGPSDSDEEGDKIWWRRPSFHAGALWLS
jgi:hypothetical protein